MNPARCARRRRSSSAWAACAAARTAPPVEQQQPRVAHARGAVGERVVDPPDERRPTALQLGRHRCATAAARGRDARRRARATSSRSSPRSRGASAGAGPTCALRSNSSSATHAGARCVAAELRHERRRGVDSRRDPVPQLLERRPAGAISMTLHVWPATVALSRARIARSSSLSGVASIHSHHALDHRGQ